MSTSDVSPLVQGMEETIYLTIFFFPCHSNIGQYVVREASGGESLDPWITGGRMTPTILQQTLQIFASLSFRGLLLKA